MSSSATRVLSDDEQTRAIWSQSLTPPAPVFAELAWLVFTLEGRLSPEGAINRCKCSFGELRRELSRLQLHASAVTSRLRRLNTNPESSFF